MPVDEGRALGFPTVPGDLRKLGLDDLDRQAG
jgi:hypothetical protein